MSKAWAGLFVIGAIWVSAPLQSQPSQPTSAEQARRSARLATFRAFAEPYVGEWNAFVEDFDADGRLVWSDRQRRIFAFSMSRHFLEERAILKRPDGSDYEGGLNLITWDPRSDRVVQHGFWLPQQPEPLYRIEGRVQGRDFLGKYQKREETGSISPKGYSMRWIDSNRWLLETTEKRADGSTFISSRITYSKAK